MIITAIIYDQTELEVIQKKRGRPKGSKNKKRYKRDRAKKKKKQLKVQPHVFETIDEGLSS